MKRRDFIKGCAGAILAVIPIEAFAEEKTALKQVGEKVDRAFRRALPPETVDASQIEWISGFSDGSCSTFDAFPDALAVLEPEEHSVKGSI